MKKSLLIIICIFFIGRAFSTELVLKGNYYGENIYLKNPTCSSENGFSISSVSVNGKPYNDVIKSNAFEIDFNQLEIKLGDSVNIIISYVENIKPTIINPEVLLPKGGFTITSIKFNPKNYELNWTTKDESSAIPFIIEQYKWNRWVKIGEIMGKARTTSNSYTFDVDLISGNNSFRVKQITPRGKEITSSEVKLKSKVPEVTVDVDKTGNSMSFSAETSYEVYNESANLLISGKGTSLDISKLPKNKVYWLSYDSKTIKFVKK